MANMTKAHYEIIAKALKDSMPNENKFSTVNEYNTALAQWNSTVELMMYAVSACNRTFKHIKFMEACGQ